MTALRQIPDPVVVRVGDHLIVAEHLGRRSNAVLGLYGWNIAWRDQRRVRRWMTVPTRERAERAVHMAVTVGVL